MEANGGSTGLEFVSEAQAECWATQFKLLADRLAVRQGLLPPPCRCGPCRSAGRFSHKYAEAERLVEARAKWKWTQVLALVMWLPPLGTRSAQRPAFSRE